MFRSSEDEDTDTTISESETNVELAKSSLTDENELVSDPEIKTGTIVRKDPLAEPISFAQISKTSEKSDSSDEESEHQDPQAQIESGLDLPDAANEEFGKMKKVLNIFTEDTGSKCTVIFKSGCSLQEKVFIEKFITNIDKVKLVLDGVTVSLNDMVPSEANSQSVLEFFDGYSLTKNVPATFMEKIIYKERTLPLSEGPLETNVQTESQKTEKPPQEQALLDTSFILGVEHPLASDEQRCFNCNEFGHRAAQCPKPRNKELFDQNMKIFKGGNEPKKGVEICDDDIIRFKGSISSELRKALELRFGEEPSFFRKMQTLGYPPGYAVESLFPKMEKKITIDGEDTNQQLDKHFMPPPLLVYDGLPFTHYNCLPDKPIDFTAAKRLLEQQCIEARRHQKRKRDSSLEHERERGRDRYYEHDSYKGRENGRSSRRSEHSPHHRSREDNRSRNRNSERSSKREVSPELGEYIPCSTIPQHENAPPLKNTAVSERNKAPIMNNVSQSREQSTASNSARIAVQEYDNTTKNPVTTEPSGTALTEIPTSSIVQQNEATQNSQLQTTQSSTLENSSQPHEQEQQQKDQEHAEEKETTEATAGSDSTVEGGWSRLKNLVSEARRLRTLKKSLQ